MIQFYGDVEAFFRRLRLKEYFQHTQQQDKSEQTTTSQHNTSQPTGEQQPPSQQNTDHQLPPKKCYTKRDSTWTPPDGRNTTLDLYIDCFRHRIQTDVTRKHHRYNKI
ncbi:Hypothetical predicted protein [Podarcis lilfordi]|uniref:Uncharacterized protein n=1 Tax=Podarcis lilfordi TaxID=74358 RepID=A0AA35QRJ5_9SAUR|nr:Hypothetical predicted protein [Podarcis lilfordi]